ncbi:MAG: hypothetical protein HKP30_08415 [Myxococcales bacterium]|nr:hypothetical protein [Myxococcales bacterium]
MAEAPGFEHTRRLQAVSDRDARRQHELFLDPAHAFDPAKLGSHRLFPLEMSWFYGEPVWHALSPEQQLMLNRLTFCQSYYSTAVAEAATNVLNYESALATFIREDPDVALYMAREVVEESVHIEAFLIVIRKVLAHYGLGFDDLRAANPSLRMAQRFVQGHSLLGWLRGDLHYYYFTRFPLNVNQKTVERCAIDEPDMDPAVRELLKNHAIDEARHMQMSRRTGQVALSRMHPWLRVPACLSFAQFAASLYIGRHDQDGRLPALTRMRTLMLCGVPEAEARVAYREWRDRKNQPEDPPLVQAGRLYYVKRNFEYVDSLDVPEWTKRMMKRLIGRSYGDVIRAERSGELRPLHFDELERAA